MPAVYETWTVNLHQISRDLPPLQADPLRLAVLATMIV